LLANFIKFNRPKAEINKTRQKTMASRATNAACSGDEDEEVLYEAPLATVVTYDQTGLVTSVTGILGVLKHKKMNITRILLRLQLGGFIAFKKNLLTGDQFHLDYNTASSGIRENHVIEPDAGPSENQSTDTWRNSKEVSSEERGAEF
jgi:hypothetical protein